MNYSDIIEARLKAKKENILKKDYIIPEPENKHIKIENRPNITQNVTNTTPIKKRGNYKDWEENWKKEDVNNPILDELFNKDFRVYLDEEGNLCYSYRNNNEKQVSKDKINSFLSNKIGKDVKFFSSDKNSIKPYEVIGIVGRTFDPFTHKRFIKIEKNIYIKNEFTPTNYMNLTEKPIKEPQTILKFISHLIGYDEKKYHYFLNWLAYFFQTLKKPQVAIVLKGKQGTGKDTLFDLIITPLFGVNQVAKLNDRVIESRFNADAFKNKLFIVFNETSQGKKSNNQDIKNFLKEIITNKSISLEEKHKKREEVKLYFASIFFTNEAKFLEIEPDDRRYNVFSTGKSLAEEKFLGFGSYEKLKKAIEKELEDFARYLYNYKVDVNLANTVINTPEKEAVIHATTPNIILFYKALKNKDLEFFRELEELEYDEGLKDNIRYIFKEIKESFKNGRIKRSLLKDIYNVLFNTKITAQTLYKELNSIDPKFLENKIKDPKGILYIIF